MVSPTASDGESSAAVINIARDTREGVEPLGRRLALLWGWVTVIGLFVFVTAGLAGVLLVGRSWSAQLRHPGCLVQLALLVLTGATWFLCRFTRQSRHTLGLLDAAAAILFCAGGALMTAFASTAAMPGLDLGGPVPAGMSMGLLATVAILTTRAALIPSTPLRTLVVSILCSLPMALVAIALSYQQKTTTGLATVAVMVSLLFVPVPTIVSAVIYRLQRQVREARQLGQYTLLSKIGEGGMGVVYQARHALLRRPTAIKLLPLERAGAESLARFEREVQQVSRLSHPNTAAIYDFGHTADGVFYYAMEYLDGLSLEELVAHDGPLPPGRVVHLLRQVCGALAEAHAAGLIHRDLKPSNLHLCSRGGLPDHLKVLDFGLVKDVGPAASDPTLSTGAGFLGTPHYIAPEAISRPENIDARADLYALGAVGYFLLTGTPPFQASSFVELCNAHLQVKPELPSQRLGRDLPSALEALVQRCLAKTPEERPASAAELGLALAACPGVWSWTEEDAARWWQKRAPAVLAICTRRREGDVSTSGERTVAVDLHERVEG